MSESYDVYRPDGEQPAPSSEARPARPVTGAWQVLVEYSNSGQAKPPTVVSIDATTYDTYDAAHAAAREVAASFEPPDPTFPQGRRVYRDGEGFLTVIDGAMSTFHVSTRIVALLDVIA